MIAAGRAVVAGLAAALVLGVVAPAVAADEEDLGPPNRVGGDIELEVVVPDVGQGDPAAPPATGEAELTDAELRWAVNHETGGAANEPGTCNFLMAGVPGEDGDTGGGRRWTDDDRDLYRSTEGDVRILVPTADGQDEEPATFDTRCDDPAGDRLTITERNTSEAEVVIDGGTGERAADGSVEIQWSGTFTVVYYSGRTYWWASDPRLELDEDGDGALTATVGGYGSSMEDMTQWERLPEQEVQLATFTDGRPDEDGATLEPGYCGVRLDEELVDDQYLAATAGVCWGSFPEDFVAFQLRTGQRQYWYSSGATGDAYKKPYPINISFDADRSIGRTDHDPGTAPPTGTGGGTTGSSGADSGSAGASAGASTTASAALSNRLGSAGPLGAPDVLATPAEAGPALFPATQAGTLGLASTGLVPELPDDGPSTGDLLAYGIALLAVGTAATVLGFRRGWLVLPFTRAGTTDPHPA
jgi:hypothetical protein